MNATVDARYPAADSIGDICANGQGQRHCPSPKSVDENAEFRQAKKEKEDQNQERNIAKQFYVGSCEHFRRARTRSKYDCDECSYYQAAENGSGADQESDCDNCNEELHAADNIREIHASRISETRMDPLA